MNFNTTKETILRWVRSCNTLEQMELCSDAIDTFIIDRFAGEIGVEEFAEAVFELHEAMGERSMQIVIDNVLILPNELGIPYNLN